MLASLLPGLRDLRIPMATGYLWLVVLWLLLDDYLPKSTEQATGPIRSLYELGGLLGSSAVVAAVSFVAYLLGSILVFVPDFFKPIDLRPQGPFAGSPRFIRVLLKPIRWAMLAFAEALARRSGAYRLESQMATFAGKRLLETAFGLGWDDHLQVLGDRDRLHIRRLRAEMERTLPAYEGSPDHAYRANNSLLWRLYANEMFDDLPAVGIQLQAKNRDLWDTYDRQRAEADFRLGIMPPLAILVLQMAILSGKLWWLFLLAAPIYLLVLGMRHFVLSASTLVQAVVLRIVEPPVLERLREYIAQAPQRDAQRAEEERARGLAEEYARAARAREQDERIRGREEYARAREEAPTDRD